MNDSAKLFFLNYFGGYKERHFSLSCAFFLFPFLLTFSQYITLWIQTQEFKVKGIILLHRNHDLRCIVKTNKNGVELHFFKKKLQIRIYDKIVFGK